MSYTLANSSTVVPTENRRSDFSIEPTNIFCLTDVKPTERHLAKPVFRRFFVGQFSAGRFFAG